MDQDSVNATLTIAAPAARVFAVLADPGTHPAIDGTGWVKEAVDPAPLTEVGQIFRVDMYAARAGGDYQMANQVAVLEAPRAIGWRPGRAPKGDEQPTFGGWIWRYDLTPLGSGETEVTLTYDWSAVGEQVRERVTFPPFGPDHLSNSLQHLAELCR
jgi:Polyketide cyclase / dehydrase and lipid transport